MQGPYGPPPSQGYPQQSGYAHQQPYYGGPPMPPPKKKMGAGMIALIVFGCLFGSCAVLGAIGRTKAKGESESVSASAPRATPGTGEPRGSAPAAPVPKAKPAATPVTAAQLFTDYQGNEVAADEDYKNRALLVSGNVSEIKKDFMDDIVVHLRTSNQFMPVDAHVEDSEKSKAARLAKGTSVTLRCTGGGMVIGRPQLRDCTFE